MKKIISILLIIVMFFVVGCSSKSKTDKKENHTELEASGKIANFTLKNSAGEDVNIYEALEESKIVIVDFWATWCGPCVKALPHLDALHKKYPELEVLAITTDGRKTVDKAKKFAQQKGYEFTVLYDTNQEVQKLLGVQAIPKTFLLGPNGDIFYEHVGYKSGDEIELENKVKALLEKLKLSD